MRGLDTNVLVRYLTQDGSSQARRANELLEGAADRGERLHVSVIVLCEMVWVLAGAYRFDKKAIGSALEHLLETSPVVIEGRDLVVDAVGEFRSGAGDFADYLLGVRNRAVGCEDTVTFDRSLKRSDLFKLI